MSSKNIIKPHDIALALKFLAISEVHKTYRTLSAEIGISIGEISEAIKRLKYTRLITPKDNFYRVNRVALLELLIHGIPYIFPTKIGNKKRGIKTAYSTNPLSRDINSNDCLVWASKEGNVIGNEIDPLYRNAPFAAKKDERFYILLALTDAVRLKGGRSYKIAIKYLEKVILEDNWNLKSDYE